VKNTPLVFDWPHRHRIHLLLPAAVLAAAAAHLAIFFVFSVAYPRPLSAGPNPARAFLVQPGDPAMAPLAGFLASADPALSAPGRGLPRTENIPPAEHIPEYESSKPELVSALPRTSRKKTAAPVFDGPLEIPRPPRASAQPAPPAPTRLIAEGPLAARLPAGLECNIPAPARQTPDSPFLVGIEPDGTVRFAFADSTGGNDSLDSAAAAFLKTIRFAPSTSDAVEWGFVRFRWGSPPPPTAAP
jgi:hypothetical protein